MLHFFSIMYGLSFIYVGVLHFISPEIFVPLVPRIISFAEFWVYLSGIFEIILGFGVCLPKYRKNAARMIILMLLVLYSANLNMWWNDIPFQGKHLSNLEHILRALVQALLIFFAIQIGKNRNSADL